MKNLGVLLTRNKQFDKNEALTIFDNEIRKGNCTTHKEIFRIANPYNKSSIQISRFKEVARLVKGESFGELSLLKNFKRSATV